MIIKPFRGTQLDLTHPMSRGLVGCWILNEGTGGILNDSSPGRNVGTLTNMDPATDWVATPDGFALDFDGSDDYINGGAVKGFTTTQGTVFCLSTTGFAFNTLSHKTLWSIYTGNDDRMITYYSRWDDKFIFLSDTGTDDATCVSSVQSFGVGTRISVCSTWDSSGKIIYIDGLADGTTSSIAPTGVSIAPFSMWTNWWDSVLNAAWLGTGTLMFMYDRALSPFEIYSLNRDPYQMFAESAVAPWFGGLGVGVGLNILDFERGTGRGASRGVMRGVG